MSGSTLLEFCALAIAVSFTAVFVTGSLALVCGILSVLFGKDTD